MNKIIKSIKRTTALIATLGIGIITLPTLLSSSETKINPILSFALANVGEWVDVATYSTTKPAEIDAKGLVDGPANWEYCGLKELKSYCINSGWSCGNTEGLSVDEINQKIRNNEEKDNNDVEKSRTYYRFLAEHKDLKTFEKYCISLPVEWYDSTMQYAMWILAGTEDSVLHQYGGSPLPPMQADLYYRNANQRNSFSNSSLNTGNTDPESILKSYNDLNDKQKSDKEKEIEDYKKTIEENETKIETLKNEIKAYQDKLTELDAKWETRRGADSLKLIVNTGTNKDNKKDNKKNNKKEESSENIKEAEKQAKILLEEQKNELSSTLNNKMDEIETIIKEILKREATIWELDTTNKNIEEVKIPKAQEELTQIKNDITTMEEIYGGQDHRVTIESIRLVLKNTKSVYTTALSYINEGREYERFFEELKKQVNTEQIEELIEKINNSSSADDFESAINSTDVQDYVRNALKLLIKSNSIQASDLKNKLIEKANSFKITEPSLNLVNTTDITKVKTIVDQDENSYIVGPFELSYVNGTFGKVSFGGITSLELIGETNGVIPIEGFIVDELNDGDLSNDTWVKEGQIHYFTPDPVEKIDRQEQSYPLSGQEFYVRFTDPGDGRNEAGIKGLRASVDWMLCNAEVKVYEAITFSLSYQPSRLQQLCVGEVDGEPITDPNTSRLLYSPERVDVNEEHQQHEATPTVHDRTLHSEISNNNETEEIVSAPRSIEPIIATVDILEEGNAQAGPGQLWVTPTGNRSNKELELITDVNGGIVPLTMNLGGRVWVDKPLVKGSNATSGLDGKRTDGEDENLPGIEVILHNYTLEQKEGKEVIAHSYNYGDKNYNYYAENKTKLLCKTVTDKDGKYFFTGLKPQYKYYVEFIYNGEVYEPTYFTDNFEPDYSHSTDTILTRKNFNKTFETVNPGGYYTVKKPLEDHGLTSGSTNKIYNYWKYSKTYAKIREENGNPIEDSMIANNGIKEIYDELIETVAKYAHNEDISTQNNAYDIAYSQVLTAHGKDPEIKNKLQFIEDCKIDDTFSGYHNGNEYTSDTTHKNKGLYPQYNKFIIGDKTINIGKLKETDEGPTSMPPIYPGILGIDLGLYERELADFNITKSIINAEVTVNEKYQKYNYKDRTTVDLNGDGKEDDWEVEQRAIDYPDKDNYYQQEYVREIRPADYEVDNTESGYTKDTSSDHYIRDQLAKARAEALGVKGKEEQELRVFITYKVKVKNQSEGIAMVPNEINDYFDKAFKLSALEYEYSNTTSEPKESNVTCKVDETEEKYNILTIKDDALIEPGASKEYMIKFEVLKTNDTTNEMLRRIILGQKENLVELMKYSTYYTDNYEMVDTAEGTQYNKKQSSAIFGESNPAYGTIDRDSIPGNFNYNNIDIEQLRSLKGEEYSKKVKEIFEDDSDLAQGLNITLTKKEDDQRTIKGLVFEDSRKTNDELKVLLGDGELGEGDTTINGVTVQLIELKPNSNTEFIIREFGGGFGSYYNYSKDSSEQEMNKNLYDKLSGIDAINTTKGKGSGNVEIEESIAKVKRPPTDNIGTKEGEELVTSYNLGEDYNKGKFAFHAFPAGDYEIRFIYGNTIKTVLVNKDSKDEDAKKVADKIKLNGDNTKSYTGNDYKSTIYQLALNNEDYNKENQFEDYIYDLPNSNAYPKMSDAKDVWEKTLYNINNDKHGSRTYVNNYSNPEKGLTNEIAEILASATSLQRTSTQNKNGADSEEDIKTRLNELMKETYMRAETGRVNVEIEKYDTNVEELENNNKSSYIIDHIYLGLTERPKSQIKLEKEVENVTLTLADGTVLFDASGTITNVTWKNNDRFKDYYNNNRLAVKYNGKERNTIELISEARKNMAGLINLYMDEELMHGAQIKIIYRITATNIGEIDFSDKEFYYTGKENDTVNNIVKTKINDIFDFVPNNLQFTEGMNAGAWKTAEDDIREKYINKAVSNEERKFNTVLHTANNNNLKQEELVPELYVKTKSEKSELSDILILTTTISPESTNDTLTYDNLITVVNTYNTVGRRAEYSVAGNGSGLGSYNIDIATAKAETVSVLPPFGQTDRTILIVSSIAGILVLVGLLIFILRRKTAKPLNTTSKTSTKRTTDKTTKTSRTNKTNKTNKKK